MKRGSIFLGTDNSSFFSKAVKNITNSFWSHCGIVLDDTDFDTYIFGAREVGCDIVTLSEYDKNPDYYYHIYEIDVPQEYLDMRLSELVREYQGSPYGYFQIIGFLIWFKLKDWFGVRLTFNPISRWVVCSELVAIYLKKLVQFKIKGLNKDINLITPEDIYQVILKNENIFKLKRKKRCQ